MVNLKKIKAVIRLSFYTTIGKGGIRDPIYKELKPFKNKVMKDFNIEVGKYVPGYFDNAQQVYNLIEKFYNQLKNSIPDYYFSILLGRSHTEGWNIIVQEYFKGKKLDVDRWLFGVVLIEEK